MAKKLGLIGVPTSMGAFAPGQEKGPGALRDADLIERLSRAGVEVVDYGDGGGCGAGDRIRVTAGRRIYPPSWRLPRRRHRG
jgi:arginase family enzyme